MTSPSSSTGTLMPWPSLLSSTGTDVANPSLRWRLGSRVVVPTVGLFSKFWMSVVNRSTIYNADVLYQSLNQNFENLKCSIGSVAAEARRRRPLITYSNHTSCMDDPLIWGALIPFWWQFNSDRHRWSAAAAEICFKTNWHSIFFSLGKTFPIIRGEGIYQPAMDFAARLLQSGQWIHFFPEGKVIPRPEHSDPKLLKFTYDEEGRPVDNDSSDMKYSYRLKWGLARLIIEHVLGEGQNEDSEYEPKNSSSLVTLGEEDDPSCTLPEVDILPIYHVGMDEVLPTRKPYIPRVFRHVTFLVRPEGPIRIDRQLLQSLFDSTKGLSLTEKRIRLMQFLEDELNRLGETAHWLHERFQQQSSQD